MCRLSWFGHHSRLLGPRLAPENGHLLSSGMDPSDRVAMFPGSDSGFSNHGRARELTAEFAASACVAQNIVLAVAHLGPGHAPCGSRSTILQPTTVGPPSDAWRSTRPAARRHRLVGNAARRSPVPKCLRRPDLCAGVAVDLEAHGEFTDLG